jgi:N-methylhydantoinase A/oxoprolinase/acetone carboxylase beta subunit
VISKLDAGELRHIGRRIKNLGIDTIAVTSVFSPINNEFERIAAEILVEAVPDAHVTLSSEIGRIGLLERENAAIMNACLCPLSGEVVAAFRTAIAKIGVNRHGNGTPIGMQKGPLSIGVAGLVLVANGRAPHGILRFLLTEPHR